jgi:hypothetical protein
MKQFMKIVIFELLHYFLLNHEMCFASDGKASFLVHSIQFNSIQFNSTLFIQMEITCFDHCVIKK